MVISGESRNGATFFRQRPTIGDGTVKKQKNRNDGTGGSVRYARSAKHSYRSTIVRG